MSVNTHALNWFEIPVADFARAKAFYESIFGYQMPENMMGPSRMGFFLHDFKSEGRGGAIVYNPDFYQPAANGTLVHLNCEPDLQVVLNRVEGAGGKVVKEKTGVSPDGQFGYWALMEDTEGNRVALHFMK